MNENLSFVTYLPLPKHSRTRAKIFASYRVFVNSLNLMSLGEEGIPKSRKTQKSNQVVTAITL